MWFVFTCQWCQKRQLQCWLVPVLVRFIPLYLVASLQKHLSGRIIDSDAKVVITADEGVRGGRAVPLKKNVDEALTNPEVKTIEKVIVMKRTGGDIDWHEHRDVWWHEATANVSEDCPPEEMKAEDPLSFFTLLVQQVNQKVFYTPRVVT